MYSDLFFGHSFVKRRKHGTYILWPKEKRNTFHARDARGGVGGRFPSDRSSVGTHTTSARYQRINKFDTSPTYRNGSEGNSDFPARAAVFSFSLAAVVIGQKHLFFSNGASTRERACVRPSSCNCACVGPYTLHIIHKRVRPRAFVSVGGTLCSLVSGVGNIGISNSYP